MLGSEVCKLFAQTSGISVFSTSRSSNEKGVRGNHLVFDLLKESYLPLLDWSNPDVIIHCAAMTNIDECEKNHGLADQVNTASVMRFFDAMKSKNPKSKLLFISSDAVKREGQPMATESCHTGPLNYYGKTKLNAEKLIFDKGGLGFKAIYERTEMPESLFEAVRLLLRVVQELDGDEALPGSLLYANRVVERLLAHAGDEEIQNLPYIMALVRQNVGKA